MRLLCQSPSNESGYLAHTMQVITSGAFGGSIGFGDSALGSCAHPISHGPEQCPTLNAAAVRLQPGTGKTPADFDPSRTRIARTDVAHALGGRPYRRMKTPPPCHDPTTHRPRTAAPTKAELQYPEPQPRRLHGSVRDSCASALVRHQAQPGAWVNSKPSSTRDSHRFPPTETRSLHL